MSEAKKVNCFDCQYLVITWDKNFPYACKRLGFKSKLLPSLEVKKDSKIECLFFEKKVKNG
ncbi:MULTISPECIES: uracil-DNA glycosylase [Calditerrivibrio]|uniref:Uracil-DNA glycosylase n=1 Tax=Calditerrivibrio nitroreducens TaxID=477976 RepID=A0A2J6WKC6_9BACT|nr:MAG: uracil-DNA glycosylase [Calditerrivibrio nitroreducens]